MLVVLINLLFMLAATVIGAVGIWWLCGRHDGSLAASEGTTQAQQAADVLARLQELATCVALEVDEHSGRVEAINEELTSTGSGEVAAIVQVVAKLVQANHHMQEKLATTESKLREQAQQLECHAIESRTDALTLLANRRAFDDEIAHRFAEFQRHRRTFSLVMIDVDLFKKFNDAHGHQAGDEVLRGVGRTLRRRTREMDVVARYGGEEFTIILPGTAIDEARHAARRAREAIEKARFHFDGKPLQVTASFGVVEVLPDEDVSGLIKRADAALYASKDAGRNCVHWHDGKDIHLVDTSAQHADNDRVSGGAVEPKGCEQSAAAGLETHGIVPLAEGEESRYGVACLDLIANLPTRSTFCQQVRARMAEWKRGGSSFSVVLVELDQFSQLMSDDNARSRSQGLQAVAELATATVREMDSVARYNPGCFAMLLPRAELAGAIHMAERLRQAASDHRLPLGDGPLRLTVSIGVVEVTEYDDIISLLKRAEAALDAASRRGGNCIFHHDGDRCAPISALLEATDYLALDR